MIRLLAQKKMLVNVASVDFSKAFNRVDHMSCLQSLADLGASNQSLEIICDFLSNRSMVVNGYGKRSSVRKVRGGTPQGTKLGNFLFCCAINNIKKARQRRK